MSDDNRAKEQARVQLDNIVEIMRAIEQLDNGEDFIELNSERYEDIDEIREMAEQDVLAVEVRHGWHAPGCDGDVEEYRVLLCTGGPAVQIVGSLNHFGEPENATLQYQDWFTPWENYTAKVSAEENEYLESFVGLFYFGG